jgi:hypothetical protein
MLFLTRGASASDLDIGGSGTERDARASRGNAVLMLMQPQWPNDRIPPNRQGQPLSVPAFNCMQ